METKEVQKILNKFMNNDSGIDDLLWIEEGRIIATNEETLSKVFGELGIGNPTIFINRVHPCYHEYSVEIPEVIG
jgi:hypothetical protein